MGARVIDLRSDTVTKPTAEMRTAMADAEVGDDVIGCDPTVARLQDYVAELLGKEAAVFMPSGSMTNQVAIRIHCKPGDEFICETDCHIYNYEQGAFAQLSGVVAKTVCGQHGVITVAQVQNLIRPTNDHLVRTRLLCLENTHNRGGGRILPLDGIESLCEWARSHGLATHLDGARLFNAVVATGIDAQTWASHFDTVSICLSKGLGAPVGSVLAGSREHMAEARRHRKLFGGGMRQSGIIAAGGLYALQHHVDRLAEDHANAKLLANRIKDVNGLELISDSPDTNILFFDVDPSLGTATEFQTRLREAGVLMLTESKVRLRALTHLDVTSEDVEQAAKIIAEVAAECRTAGVTSSV
ncbi:MAG: low-specificity L-threonine aldolase [Planctomycetales bacterium]|nr:low-specificity L-threonine aldolase [Planctomycetales bacterium]